MSVLSECNVIANITISSFTGWKSDKSISLDVAQREEVDRRALKSVKNIFGENCPELSKIKNIESNARIAAKTMSLPWDDNGRVLVPSSILLTFMEKMKQFKTEHKTAVDELNLVYNDLKDKAKINLKNLYKESDYPTNISDQFSFIVSYEPVPDSNLFEKISGIESFKEALISDHEDELKNKENEALEAIKSRLKERLQHVIDKLTTYSKSVKGSKFHDSWIVGTMDLSNTLQSLNFTKDERLTDWLTRVNILFAQSPTLYKDDMVKLQTINSCKVILGEMS